MGKLRSIRPHKVKERAKKDLEHRKLYSFRFKEELMNKLGKDADSHGLSLTGLIEAIIKDYLRLPG